MVKSRLYRAGKKHWQIWEAGEKEDGKKLELSGQEKISEDIWSGRKKDGKEQDFRDSEGIRRAAGKEAMRNGRDKGKETGEQRERRQ